MTILKATLMSGDIGTRVHLPVRRGPSWINRLFRAVERHRRFSRDYDALLEMPDYMLNDIGLTRFDVRREQERHNRIFQQWPH